MSRDPVRPGPRGEGRERREAGSADRAAAPLAGGSRTRGAGARRGTRGGARRLLGLRTGLAAPWAPAERLGHCLWTPVPVPPSGCRWAHGRLARRGRRLHRGDAPPPPPAWLARSPGLLALRRGSPTARGRGGAALPQAAGTISGRRFPRRLTSARHSRREGPLLRRSSARGLGPLHPPRASLRAPGASTPPAPRADLSGLRLLLLGGVSGSGGSGRRAQGVVPPLPGAHCPEMFSALPTESQTKIPGLPSPLPAAGSGRCLLWKPSGAGLEARGAARRG